MADLNRCRLMLAASPQSTSSEQLIAALGKDDIASIILYCHDEGFQGFAEFCEAVVPHAQSHDIAVLVADDTQTAGRSGADGYYLERERSNLNDALARFSPQKIVGCGGMLDRDQALKIGETGIDFVVFGKLGRDSHAEPHRKNIALGQWWSEFVELPSVVLGGNAVESVVDVAKTGADFAMLEQAVFAKSENPHNVAAAIAKANKLLDEHAPVLEEADG
ncbi:MAG: thiamine phosphate synthase [Rhizobiaceae bacterium]|nr:thiamine phosphate synthase [Rhizobiaceae bacterium]